MEHHPLLGFDMCHAREAEDVFLRSCSSRITANVDHLLMNKDRSYGLLC